jgi:hypothetical protein
MGDDTDRETFINCYKGDTYAEAIVLFGEWLRIEMSYSEDRYSEAQYATLKLVSDKFFNEVQSTVERQ